MNPKVVKVEIVVVCNLIESDLRHPFFSRGGRSIIGFRYWRLGGCPAPRFRTVHLPERLLWTPLYIPILLHDELDRLMAPKFT